MGVQLLVHWVLTCRPGLPSTIEKLTFAWSGMTRSEQSLSSLSQLVDSSEGGNAAFTWGGALRRKMQRNRSFCSLPNHWGPAFFITNVVTPWTVPRLSYLTFEQELRSMPFSKLTCVEVDVWELFCLASVSGPRWASVGVVGDGCSFAVVLALACSHWALLLAVVFLLLFASKFKLHP